MKKSAIVVVTFLVAAVAWGQLSGPQPVFSVKLAPDREPAVAGEELRVAVMLSVDRGWHVNTDDPGDDFLVPTSVEWQLPAGWAEPVMSFPDGRELKFDFSDQPIEVWEGAVGLMAVLRVPETAMEAYQLRATVTAQACNNTQCLPPLPVSAVLEGVVGPAGTVSQPANHDVFADLEIAGNEEGGAAGSARAGRRASLPWVLGVLVLGVGALVLVGVRPAHGRPGADRVSRAVIVLLMVAGALLLPTHGGGERTHLTWERFDRDQVAAALAGDEPVILDFYADWCAPCRELDEKTFSDPRVASVLDGFARFKIDLTASSDATDLLRDEYEVLGVPTVVVLRDGSESFRITGFEPADRFLERLGGVEEGNDVGARLAQAALPLQLVLVFLAGLALNLTPCVYPLIPITVGFFCNQAKDRPGGSFGLALVYVLGMSVTYSVLGVVAALTGQLFGAALQSPAVIGVIVAVLLALAASMFGVWELRVPEWALRASGGKSGVVGALLMGLVVGFVAAPCIGPFVLGLLTYVGQQGSPLLGLALFFTLSMGLGLPYLLLGGFTGLINRLPASGAWMIGIRKVFGILLVALAVYFAQPLLPVGLAGWAMGVVLAAGGLYLLLVDRTGHEQPAIDRVIRLVSAAMVVVGIVSLPLR